MQEYQEVLTGPRNVSLDPVIKIAQPVILNCRNRSTSFSIRVGPVHERDRITDLARICRRDDLGAVILPLSCRAGSDPIRGKIYGGRHPESSELQYEHLTCQKSSFCCLRPLWNALALDYNKPKSKALSV